MAHSSFDDDEKPLDPTLLRVQAKLRRLMLVGGLTLALGIFAVFAVILYKIVHIPDKAPPAAAWQPGGAVPTLSRAEMGLPPGAKLIATSSDGQRLILTYEKPGGGQALVFVDLATLKVTGRLDLKGQ